MLEGQIRYAPQPAKEDLILELLRTAGPLKSAEIVKRLGQYVSESHIYYVLGKFREEGKLQP